MCLKNASEYEREQFCFCFLKILPKKFNSLGIISIWRKGDPPSAVWESRLLFTNRTMCRNAMISINTRSPKKCSAGMILQIYFPHYPKNTPIKILRVLILVKFLRAQVASWQWVCVNILWRVSISKAFYSVEFLRVQVASWQWVCVNILWLVSVSKAFYKAAAELCKAAQLWVFILGMWYLGLGVLRHVFGVRYVVYVLIILLSQPWVKQPCSK